MSVCTHLNAVYTWPANSDSHYYHELSLIIYFTAIILPFSDPCSVYIHHFPFLYYPPKLISQLPLLLLLILLILYADAMLKIIVILMAKWWWWSKPKSLQEKKQSVHLYAPCSSRFFCPPSSLLTHHYEYTFWLFDFNCAFFSTLHLAKSIPFSLLLHLLLLLLLLSSSLSSS